MGKKVFISYAREDLEHAKKLHVDLKSAGHDPWLDNDDLLAGQNWRQTIPKLILKADHVLFLISNQSVPKRGYVQVELKRALDAQEEFPVSDIFIIPVRLDECELPVGLENLNWVDLFDDYEEGLNKIIRALEFKKEMPPEPPPDLPDLSPPGIYVSYSVHDNVSNWVSEFAKHLESQLVQRLGGADGFTFSIDFQAVDESPTLPSNIINSIKNSTFLIAVTSPGFANSERCKRELNTFLRAVENRPEAQIFVMERETPNAEAMPDRLKRERPRQFWKKDNEGFPFVLESSHPQYAVLINRLSHELAEAVKCVEPVLVDTPPSDENNECLSEISDDCPPVFLAEVTENLLQLRDEVEAYLEQAGLRVVPKSPLLTTDADAFEKAVTDALAPCRVFVQLLDGNSGKSRALPSGICLPQAECAEKAGKTILQWRRSKLELKAVTDEDHLELLQGENVVADSLEVFKKQVRKRAAFKPQKTEAPTPPSASGRLVFLNADRKDEPHAKEVEQVMTGNAVDCALPVWEGKQSDILKDMEDFILNSDGLIVIYGDVDAIWVRKQLMYCRNLIYRRERPLNAFAVYEGPPPEKTAFNISLPGMHIINCRDCLKEEEFQPFFEDLRKGGQS